MIVIYLLMLIIWLTKQVKSNELFSSNIMKNVKVDNKNIEQDFNIDNLPITTSTRKTLEISEDVEDKLLCPEGLQQFTYMNSNSKFCSDDKKMGKNNNTCSLNPYFRKGFPLCETYPCPDGLKLVNPESGGVCTNGKKKCVLDPNLAQEYDLCYDRSDYNEINDYTYSSKIILDAKQNSSIDECKIKCNNNPQCGLFTMDNSNCSLYNMLQADTNIKNKTGKSVYFKNPYNYLYEDDVTINGGTISQHTLHTVNDCGILCDKDDKCKSFVWGKNEYMGDCILKNTRSKTKKEYNPGFDLYSKKYLYANNEGKICKNHTKTIHKKINESLNDINSQHETNIFNQKIKNDITTKDIVKRTHQTVKNNVINNYLNSNNMIIWNNINLQCNTINIIRPINNSSLQISTIQIYGIDKLNNNKYMNLTTINDIAINISSGNDHKIKDIFNSNLSTLFKTENEDNPYITIKFPRIMVIYKIIIYGGINNTPTILYPLKIELYNDDKFVKHAIKNNMKAAIKLSKNPPKIPTDDFTYETRGITDFGNPDDFKGWVDVSKNGSNYDYCRIITDQTTKNDIVSCAILNSDNQYQYNSKPGIDLGIKKTQYMKDETGNNRDDFCRCIGKYPNTYVSCVEANKDSFGDEFIPANKPSPCNAYTGKQLSKIDYKNNNINLCTDIPAYANKIKYKVSTGFYNYKQNSYYLFKNTILNNKKVILMNVFHKNTHKIRKGYPTILTPNIWPDLPPDFYQSIDAILYVGNNSIVIFKNNRCVFYHLSRQHIYTIDYHTKKFNFNINKDNPPLIRNVFPNLPFTSISAAANIDPHTKSNNNKISIFENLLSKSILALHNPTDIDLDSQNPIDVQNIIKFYNKNYTFLDSDKTTANKMIDKIKTIFCKTKNINDVLSEMYTLLCSNYIPKCRLFFENKFVEYSLTTTGNSTVIVHPINSKTLNTYTYSNVDAVVSFYDTKNLKSFIFYKNIYFIQMNGNTKPIIKQLQKSYPHLWDIYLDNLGSLSKNIITIKLSKIRKLEFPKITNITYTIKINIYEQSDSTKQTLKNYLEFPYSVDSLQNTIIHEKILPKKNIQLYYNKHNNSKLIFKLLIDDQIVATTPPIRYNTITLTKKINLIFTYIDDISILDFSPKESPELYIEL